MATMDRVSFVSTYTASNMVTRSFRRSSSVASSHEFVEEIRLVVHLSHFPSEQKVPTPSLIDRGATPGGTWSVGIFEPQR